MISYTFNHLTVLIAVFAFMMVVVGQLPSLVSSAQERYKNRTSKTSRELDRFFLAAKPTHILIAGAAVGLLLGVLTRSWVLGGACVLAGMIAPRVLLSLWIDIRSARFDTQLMDALILISNALRSGLDIATGIELVAKNMKAPISEEFGLVMNAYRLGAPLEDALQEMTRRIRSRPLETAVGAILMQRESGGNLIKTFEQLVVTIRDETKLQGKVKALSAQGRTQIAFLSTFPWIMGGVFYMLSPALFKPALENPWCQIVLVFLVVWEGIGILVTKRIVTVDV